eukprot:30903_1
MEIILLLLSSLFNLHLCFKRQSWYKYDKTLPQPLMYHQLVYFKHINTVYLFGGKSTPNHTNIYQRSIYKWNISNHSSWFELIDTTTPTVNFSSYGNNVVEVNNKAYFIGIYDGSWASGQIYVFDPSNDSFLNHNLTSPPDISSQGCLTTNKTHILMAGGRHSIESFCDDLQIYDTQRNVWDLQPIRISPIYHNGIYAQYCVMVNNTLFTFGGSSQNVYLNEYYKFESIEDNRWSLLGTKSTSTRSGAAVYYNKLNRIYLIGGFAGHSPVSNIDDFDVAEQKIVATYHTVQPLFGAPAFISNDKLYIFG